MANDLVGYSRAGDAFHYRWAARRCLHMCYPNTSMRSVFVEGSAEVDKAGEYVIDVAEYHEFEQEQYIDYYQLKHSTTQVEVPFTLSDLKTTFEGFAKRFIQHNNTQLQPHDVARIRFIILTNRQIADDLDTSIRKIALGSTVNARFLKTIEEYTGLANEQLRAFCSVVEFQAVKENYIGQKDELQSEISLLLASTVNNPQLESVIAMVADKALPHSDHKIIRENVLQKFGITSERELYPAPPRWERDTIIIPREQYADIRTAILAKPGPFIVHAGGGVGKSVLCRYLETAMDKGSLAIAFDCFGAGDYRNRSTLRHGHRNALVQICNELAVRGLCAPLLVQNDSDEQITRAFIQRVEIAIHILKSAEPNAKLMILIDAADNAEMAADEFNQNCFANELLREKFSDDVRLVMLCRTERIHLLRPQSLVCQLPLLPFSEDESHENLKQWYADADEMDGKEFHRLTTGNPRVQASALAADKKTVADLLQHLGPAAVTIEDLIAKQLQFAIDRMKDLLPSAYQIHIHAIATGLASLPPHIPLSVLSSASEVGVEHIKSFVSDIGRSLWLSDDSVQFRDEPTETWFRTNFASTADGYKEYIKKLEPLAIEFTYVAESLPMLYLQAGDYQKLLNIALSDDFLPKQNPIEERNVRVFRLKFAFQAALRLSNFTHAIKIAMRAGEEIAGDQRQSALLKDNIDLLSTLQNHEKVQQIAYRRALRGGWPGSENIYSACALSFIPEFKGEARSYVRSAKNWLDIYFDDVREKQKAVTKKYERVENNVQNEDIFELAFAILNVSDSSACLEFLKRLQPRSIVANILGMITDRLIDHGRFSEVDELLTGSILIPDFFIVIVDKLVQIGRFPHEEGFETVLILLAHKKTRVEKKSHDIYDPSPIPRILSFLEGCLHHSLAHGLITRVLKHYVPERIAKEELNFHSATLRTNFFRGLAIRSIVVKEFKIVVEDILPETPPSEKKAKNNEEELKEYKEVIFGLFPWFKLRADVILGQTIDLLELAKAAAQASNGAINSRYRTYDFIPGELIALRISVIAHCHNARSEEIQAFYQDHIQNSKEFNVSQQLDFARIVFRNVHLNQLKHTVEGQTRKDIVSSLDDGPEEISNRYIQLARAVVINSIDDASVYFDEAITIVSKFGDEILYRWNAVSTLGECSVVNGSHFDKLAYRFIRCAEVVGKNSREKHWSRNDALRVCLRLSPNVGIAALSRWRDRGIGYFDYLLNSMLRELMMLNLLSPKISWGLSKMRGIATEMEFVMLHLDQPNHGQHDRQLIFDDAVEMIGKQGYLEHYWSEISAAATKYQLTIPLSFGKSIPETRQPPEIQNNLARPDKQPAVDWSAIFTGVALTSVEGLETAYERFQSVHAHQSHYQFGSFCEQLFQRCTEHDIFKLVDAYLSSRFAYYSEVPVFFSSFPEAWLNKASFKKQWPEIITVLGEQFAGHLHSDYAFRSFCKELKLNDTEKDLLKSGIFGRFAQSADDQNAEFFFDFVSLACSKVTKEEANGLLDYALERFKLHIEDEFGDGPWESWLEPKGDITYHLSGFLWSALGSPWTSSRWKVVHALTWLAAVDEKGIFDNIFECAKRDTVDSFGSRQFVFYNLHARLYLLFACAKTALSNGHFLEPYLLVFESYCLQPHALIQKLCADIISRLIANNPNLVPAGRLKQIKEAVSSPFKTLKRDYKYHVDSYRHTPGQEQVDGEYFFGIDFPQYWYEPLGRVFGVRRAQVCDLAKEVVIKDWHVGDLNGYQNDARRALWNSYSEERETWHDHSSYPRADSLDFYHSYHAMFVVASNLLRHMPIVLRNDDDDHPWKEWLGRHYLTFDNGKWLSDFRGEAPIERPSWVKKQDNSEWKAQIKSCDLIKMITTTYDGKPWVFIDGSWHEIDNSRKETYRVSTALVNPQTADALLNSLSSYKDPWDYKIPSYQEEDHEFSEGMFDFKGWIHSPYLDRRIDGHDIESQNITHLYSQVGAGFQKMLGLTSCEDGRQWFIKNNTQPVIVSEIYCTELRGYSDEEADQSGNRMKASAAYLIDVSKSLDYDILFEIHVTRSFTYKSGSREKSEKYELFLLKSDGTIKTTDKNFRLG